MAQCAISDVESLERANSEGACCENEKTPRCRPGRRIDREIVFMALGYAVLEESPNR